MESKPDQEPVMALPARAWVNPMFPEETSDAGCASRARVGEPALFDDGTNRFQCFPRAPWVNEEQAEFVRWWKERVSPNQGARTDIIVDRRFSLTDAENLTGITKQQVSKWNQKLKNPPAPWGNQIKNADRRF